MMSKTKTKALWIVLRAGLPNYKVDARGERFKYGLNVPQMAQDMGVTKKTVFEWLLKNELPGRRAKQLTNLSASTLTLAELEQFITSA